MRNINEPQQHNVIEKRLFRQSIWIALLLTLILSTVQVWLNYRDLIDTLNNSFRQIENIQIQGISTALWNFNMAELTVQTEGLIHFPFINYAEVRDNDRIFSIAGFKKEQWIIEKEIQLFHVEDNTALPIGLLYIQANTQAIYSDLLEQINRILLFQAINVIIVIIFMLILINRDVIRHLNTAAQYFRSMDIKKLGEPLKLNKASKNDELDAMVNAFNSMKKDLLQAYQLRVESERKHATLLSNLPGMAFRCHIDRKWTMELVSAGCLELTGYEPAELIDNDKLSYADIIIADDRESVWDSVQASLSPDKHYEITYRIRTKQGPTRWVWEKGSSVFDDKQNIVAIEGFISDISERKQQERELEAIAAISYSLRSAGTLAEMQPVILEQTIKLLNAEGGTLELIDPISGDAVVELAYGIYQKQLGTHVPPDEGLNSYIRQSGKPYLNNITDNDPKNLFPETYAQYHASAGAPLIAHGQMLGFLWIGRKVSISQNALRALTAIADIAANAIYRVRLFEQTEQRLFRLDGLRKIDTAINNNQELDFTLNTVLEQAVALLHADIANLVLLKNDSTAQYFESGKDILSRSFELDVDSLEEHCSGQSIKKRKPIIINNLQQNNTKPCYEKMIAEGYASFFSVPLITKNEIKGVLQVFRKTPFYPDPDWIDFLETLAGQAAIAISDSQLFQNLQRSNQALQLAYDKTIEGWSRALDLRDHETGWHSQRVTQLTLSLAKLLEIPDEDLVNIQRGALLHDIGKMGVPDNILLKRGELTPDEWETIRKHPDNAYKLLSPIEYLHKALDIPYCHHEKWDGSGYPRGLKGTEIPLAARIFAVVDVWDALTSDRPYRKAVSHSDTLLYILEQSGKHFDPHIVDLFHRFYNSNPEEFNTSEEL